MAKYRRQREYRPDCLEWAGLCRFLGNPRDTKPKEERPPPPSRGVAEAAAASGGGRFPSTSGFAISGTLHSVNGSVLTFTNRHGKDRLIDASEAIANGHIAAALTYGEAYTAVGSSLHFSGRVARGRDLPGQVSAA